MNEHDTSRSTDARTGSAATAAAAGPESPGRPARLLRFPDEGPGAGVAAGLGAYFGLDPVFFRIAFLLLAFAGGSGVLLYGIGWLVIPAAAPGETARRQATPPSDRTAQWVGIGLIVAAAFWLTGPFDLGGPVLWALALVAIGVILFREDANRRSREAPTATAWGEEPPVTRSPGAASGGGAVAPGGGAAASGGEADASGGTAGGSIPADAPDAAPTPAASVTDASGRGEENETDDEETVLEEAARLREGELAGWSAGGWEGGADAAGAHWTPPPPPPAAPAPAPRRSFLGRATVGVALVAVGFVALADNLAPGMSVSPARYLALLLTIVGGGLLVGAWRGRARGLIPVGLLLLPLLAATAVFPFGVPWHGGVGERVAQPAALADVGDEYRLGAGQLTVDLSDVDFSGEEHTTSASVALGQLVVVVPEDVDVTVNASASAGELDLLGQTTAGTRVQLTVTDAAPDDAAGLPPDGGSLTLDLESGLGQVTVSRAAG